MLNHGNYLNQMLFPSTYPAPFVLSMGWIDGFMPIDAWGFCDGTGDGTAVGP
jgi:hypothetical protein